MTREEITKHVKQVIKTEMLKKDMNFVELQKVMEEKGYNYSLDAIRQKVGRVHMILGFCMSFRRVLRLL